MVRVPAPELSVVVPCFNERANVAPLVARLEAALVGLRWEVIFVDDDSPDGTEAAVRAIGAEDGRIRCIRRIGRRGLSSAVIEGMLASSAETVAVMDGDLQHDETILPRMLQRLQVGDCDIVVASRHVEGGSAEGLEGAWRTRLSQSGIRLAQTFLPNRLSDPMSGFFMIFRQRFADLAPGLTGRGFKILLDLLLTARPPLRVEEIPYHFQERQAGESKLDALVLTQFAALLLDKTLRGLVPLRFVSFAAVGAFGVLVQLAALTVARDAAGLDFSQAQRVATLVAMAANFQLNNSITYRDQRLRGARLWRGLVIFILVCGLGAVANIGIAQVMYNGHSTWTLAGATGAAVGVVWNYAVSSTLVWRRQAT